MVLRQIPFGTYQATVSFPRFPALLSWDASTNNTTVAGC